MRTDLPGNGNTAVVGPTEEGKRFDGRMRLASIVGWPTAHPPGSEGGSFGPT